MAWIEAMDAACDAACAHGGSEPIDPLSELTPAQYNLAWDTNATLAAGVAALAEAAARHKLDWPEILEVALAERDESTRHRLAALPAPRAG